MSNTKVYEMSFAKIYPLLVNKATRKGRLQEEVNQVIEWLTGYNDAQLQEAIDQELSYQDFFEKAPSLNPNRHLIKGSICGVKIENIEEPLMKEIRYLDKLIDELAKGKAMDKILRK